MPLPQTYSFNFGLIRELSSAFCTAAGKHLAAVSRCHSLAEAMFLRTLALFGLICSEHVFSYLLNYNKYSTSALADTPKQLTIVQTHF